MREMYILHLALKSNLNNLIRTRNSAVADESRNELCQSKSCQLVQF